MWGLFLFLLITELSPSSYSGMPACVFYLSLRYIILLTFKFKKKREEGTAAEQPQFSALCWGFLNPAGGKSFGQQGPDLPQEHLECCPGSKGRFLGNFSSGLILCRTCSFFLSNLSGGGCKKSNFPSQGLSLPVPGLLLELGSAVLAVRVKKGAWRMASKLARARAVLCELFDFPRNCSTTLECRGSTGELFGGAEQNVMSDGALVAFWLGWVFFPPKFFCPFKFFFL